MSKRFLTSLLLFLGIYLVLSTLFLPSNSSQKKLQDIEISPLESVYALGEDVVVQVMNNLDYTISVDSQCPANPLRVELYNNGTWNLVTSDVGKNVQCGDEPVTHEVYTKMPSRLDFSPRALRTISFAAWKDQLFSELGKYRVILDVNVENEPRTYVTEFEIAERGFFSAVSFQLLYRPIFNLLVFFTSVLPGHNLGLAVIVLTLLIRFILLVPNQKAMKSQQAMMEIQPELDAIRKKYEGDQERISRETMALWQKHKVSPVGGCLPLLIQLPFMIALFYTIKSGFTPYQSYEVYGFLQSFDLSLVDRDFYGLLDLDDINANWLPLLVGLVQFVQMKLSFARQDRGKSDQIIDVADDGSITESKKQPQPFSADSMKNVNKTMMYFIPVVIALTTASLPSAVGLYLLVSTLFGVFQQYFISRARSRS